MSSNTLDNIIFAINDILKAGILIKRGNGYTADLKNKVITIKELDNTPLTYFLLRHEKYHFSVFPKTYERREEIINKVGKKVYAEFVEDWYFVKIAYNIVSNAIVNRYGLYCDPYINIFREGHDIWLNKESAKKGDSIIIREYIKLLDEDLLEEDIISRIKEIYEAIIL